MTYGNARSLLFVGVLGLAPQLHAQAQGQGNLHKFDTNRNGFVEMAEHDASMRKKFDETDTNRDGVMVVGEEAVYMANATNGGVVDRMVLLVAQKAGIDQWDRNGDDKISYDEYKRYTDGIRDGMDLNRDGKLSPSELGNVRSKR